MKVDINLRNINFLNEVLSHGYVGQISIAEICSGWSIESV